MVLKWIFIVILFITLNYLENVKANHDIKIDFDIQFDVPNHNHNVSSKESYHKTHSSFNQTLVSGNGTGPRYKVHEAKSRSITGLFRQKLENMLFSFLQINRVK